MPLGSFRLNGLAKLFSPSEIVRSWDVYDGSNDSIEFELTDIDVGGSSSCVVDGKLLIAFRDSVNLTICNLRLFQINSDDPSNYSVTLLASGSYTSAFNINARFLRMARLDTDKVIIFVSAYTPPGFGPTQEVAIITTTNNTLSLGALQVTRPIVNSVHAQVINGGGVFVITPQKVVTVGGQNRSLGLYTINGDTVTVVADLNAATIFSNAPRPESWVTKINNDRILIVTAFNTAGSGADLENQNAAILDISNNTFSVVTVQEGIAQASTNDFYSWGIFGRGFIEYGDSTGVLLTNQRTVNNGRANQTKFFPGANVIQATASSITGPGTSNTWVFEFDDILKSSPTDFTSGSPSVPTVADNPYTIYLQDNTWLVFMRSCNNISRETDPSFHQVHILKQDNLTLAPPTNNRYAPQLIYSKPQGEFLFDFDNALAHRVDKDTAIVTFNKGRANATTGPNGRVACRIIKAPPI